MEFDDILPKLGQFGRYQKFVYFMLCIPASLPAVFLTFNQVFMSATPEHWCEIPELKDTNMTLQQRLNLSISRQFRSL
uniref:Major facilitator superfamily (MFS) profile domain-containing protein n=1 Tax=Strigamia maritima TaxID=126957 RepID=T1J273_STRMM